MEATELKRRERIVVEEYEGMLPYCVVFYIYSIHYAADRAIDAYRRFNAANAEGRPPLESVAMIQEALAHAAALSRFFWPVRNRSVHIARAARLRAMFSAANKSPLRSKSLRGAFEHFDERLDLFLLERDTGHFFLTPMAGTHALADDPAGVIFRLIDAEEHVFVLLSKKYYFAPILDEASRIAAISGTMIGRSQAARA